MPEAGRRTLRHKLRFRRGPPRSTSTPSSTWAGCRWAWGLSRLTTTRRSTSDADQTDADKRRELTMRSARRLIEGRLLLTLGRAAAVSVLAVVTAMTFISTADASSRKDAKDAAGTVAVTDRAILMSYRHDKDVVQERLVHRILTGTFAGSEVSLATYTIHPDGSATISAVSSCTCTVDGRTGTVTFKDRGTASA